MGINDKVTPSVMLDSEGKKRLLEQISEEIKKMNYWENQRAIAIANEGAGSRIGENPGKDHAEAEIRRCVSRTKELESILCNAIWVGRHNENGVDFGDVVTLLEDNEKSSVCLVSYAPNYDAKIQEISIESPLGKAIYRANIGDVCRLSNGYTVTILDIAKKEQFENNKPKVKTRRARQ